MTTGARAGVTENGNLAMTMNVRERQKRFRSRQVRSGKRELKFWVPENRVDEIRAAVAKILEAEPELPFGVPTPASQDGSQ